MESKHRKHTFCNIQVYIRRHLCSAQKSQRMVVFRDARAMQATAKGKAKPIIGQAPKGGKGTCKASSTLPIGARASSSWKCDEEDGWGDEWQSNPSNTWDAWGKSEQWDADDDADSMVAYGKGHTPRRAGYSAEPYSVGKGNGTPDTGRGARGRSTAPDPLGACGRPLRRCGAWLGIQRATGLCLERTTAWCSCTT